MRLSKRVIASRAAGAKGAAARRKRRTSRDNSQSAIPDIEPTDSKPDSEPSGRQPGPPSQSLQPRASNQASTTRDQNLQISVTESERLGDQDLNLLSGTQSERDSDPDSSNESGELSEEEDQRPMSEYPIGQPAEEDQRPMSVFPVRQPAEGWHEAERKAPGYSRTQVYRQKAYYHRYKDELKRRRKEKTAREAGIPVSKKAKPIYGDIALLFGAKASPSHLPEREEIPSVPPDCIAPPVPEESAIAVPPDFEEKHPGVSGSEP